MNNTYNESGYYLYFPTWTSPIATSALTGPRYKSIPGFLGFNYKEYYLNRAYSAASLPLTNDSISADNTDKVFYIDNTNNYFTIYKYIGPAEYSTNSDVDISFNIKLSLTAGTYTRTQLITDLSNQLSSNTYLNGSSIKRIDITDPSLNNNGKSFFRLQITYNRLTTNNTINSKTYYLNDKDRIKLSEIVRNPMEIDVKFKEFSFNANLEFVSYDISFDDNAYMNVNYKIPEIILKPNNTNKVIKIKSLNENITNTIIHYLNEDTNYIEDNFRLPMEDAIAGQVFNESFGLNNRSDYYLNLYINIIEICNKDVKWIHGEMNDVIKYFEDIIKKAENSLSESFNYFRN
jgi:hypothetical protein